MNNVFRTLIGIGALSLPLNGWTATGAATIKATDDSDISGHLKFEDTNKGLHIWGDIQDGPTGVHGFHIHEFGDCGDEGKKAGSHYNPDKKSHGHVLKDGLSHAHAGDLGNLTIGPDGSAKVDITVPQLTLSGGRYPVGGRAVIIHEKKDDFGQPVGNAGGRIGCGPIVLTGN